MAATYGITSTHIEASGQVIASNAQLVGFIISALSGSTGHVLFYDTIGAPSGQPDKIEIDVGSQGYIPLVFPDGKAMVFGVGIYVVVPANVHVTVFYEDQ